MVVVVPEGVDADAGVSRGTMVDGRGPLTTHDWVACAP